MRSNCMYRLYLLALTALLLPLVCAQLFAQTTWVIEERLATATLGDVEEGYEITNTMDGGALVIGPIYHSNCCMGVNPSVTRLNPVGGVVWTRTYDFQSWDSYSIKELDNGDIIWTCAGPGQYGNAIIVCRTNSSGVFSWATRLDCPPPAPPEPQSVNLQPTEVIEATNGNIVVVGYRETPELQDGLDIYLARLNKSGALMWANIYDNPALISAEGGSGVVEVTTGTLAGHLCVSGFHQDVGSGAQHALILNTSSSGTLQWTGHYGNGVGCDFRSILYNTNGDLYAAGHWDQAGFDTDIYVAAVNRVTGGLIASNRYDVLDKDGAYDINFSLTANNVVVAGLVTNPFNNPPQRNSFAMELFPALGFPAGNAQYGTVYEDFLRSIAPTVPTEPTPPLGSKPGYWMTGKIVSTAAIGTGADSYVLRSAPSLATGCETMPVVTTLAAPGATLVNYTETACLSSAIESFVDVSELAAINKCPGQYILPKRGADDAAIGDIATADHIQAFPNPVSANGELQLDLSGTRQDWSLLEIRDIQGRIFFRRMFEGERVNADLSISTQGWTAGLYLVKLTSAEGTQTLKVVVMN